MGTDYIDLGRVAGDAGTSMRYRNLWANGIEYVHNDQYIDMVTHAGSLWVCNTTNTSQEPAEDSEVWRLAARGMDDGASVSDAIAYFTVPETYTEPKTGGTIADIIAKLVKGVRDLTTGKASSNRVKNLEDRVTTLDNTVETVGGQVETINSNLATPVRDTLWSGTAGANKTITLSKSLYDYNEVYFSNDVDGIRAKCLVTNNLAIIRAGGMTVTSAGNIGSFGVTGDISNGGKTIAIKSVAYMTHIAGGSNSTLTTRNITSVIGIR